MLFFPQFESACGSGPLGAGDPKGTRHLMVSICPDRAFQNKQVWFSTTLQGAASYLIVCLMRGKERAFERSSEHSLARCDVRYISVQGSKVQLSCCHVKWVVECPGDPV